MTVSNHDPAEIARLSLLYGKPVVKDIEVDADEYLFRSRKARSQEKRGEVVMVIERTKDQVLLHRKAWYERGVYRLLSGGIDIGESAEETLHRELHEETGLRGGSSRFLGLLSCKLHFKSESFRFDSYIFHIQNPQGRIRIPSTLEDISDFIEVPITELPTVSENLRSIIAPRSGWGRWRALAHDFTYEVLS
jgi:ADP-ribose pyrophosphatase YjhB (NUDIX family)